MPATVISDPAPWFAVGWNAAQMIEHKHARAVIEAADCREALARLPDCSVDSIVTDPPYELGFMGKAWDASGIAYDVTVWREALRVLKPGGHMLAFSGSRTYHRMVVAIEDAGFEIRDQIMWLYGSGFPKSLDVSKAIDKAAGVEFGSKPASGVGFMGADGPGGYNPTMNQLYRVGEPTDAARQWQGWGTALKPAHEPICVARKPLAGTVAANVLAHGAGALNIDGCRVPAKDGVQSVPRGEFAGSNNNMRVAGRNGTMSEPHESGRWPANVIHDGSDEVMAAFPQAPGQMADVNTKDTPRAGQNVYGATRRGNEPSANSENTGSVGFKMRPGARRLDAGSAARFFYCAKASKSDRGEGNTHPTVKPNALMRYLCRLVAPPGGLVLDPFLGSGSTGLAALQEGFTFYGCDLDPAHVAIAARRMEQ